MTTDDLLAREAIRHCLLRHFRAADRCDAALMHAAWWDDGRFVGGPVEGTAIEFVPVLMDMLPAAFDAVMHYIANTLIDVAGDCARAELYGIGWHLLIDNPAAIVGAIGETAFANIEYAPGKRFEMLVGVRYAVTLALRGTEWRIITMQPIIEWTRVQPSTGIVEGGLPAAMPTLPHRDTTDASYFGGDWRP